MKILTRVLITVVFISYLFGCTKNDAGSAVNGISLHFIDSARHELFVYDTVVSNGYYTDSIQLFDITEGKAVLPYCLEDRKKNMPFRYSMS